MQKRKERAEEGQPNSVCPRRRQQRHLTVIISFISSSAWVEPVKLGFARRTNAAENWQCDRIDESQKYKTGT